jgi:hypothetical protein
MTTATLLAPEKQGVVSLDDRERAVALAFVHGASLETIAGWFRELPIETELRLGCICQKLGVAGADELRHLLRRWVC